MEPDSLRGSVDPAMDRNGPGSFVTPARSRTVVLVLDLITDLDFPGGDRLRAPALRAAGQVRRLIERADRARVPVLYVNDNLGRWRSDAPSLIARCKRPESAGRAIVERIEPGPRHGVLLKPKHSAFFGTPLAFLLERLGARRLVLTGVSAHQCVLFTATDAHMRDYALAIPRDCVAAARARDTALALRHFETVLDADTRPASAVALRRR